MLYVWMDIYVHVYILIQKYTHIHTHTYTCIFNGGSYSTVESDDLEVKRLGF